MESDDIAYRLPNTGTVQGSYSEDTKGLRESEVLSEELFDEPPEHFSTAVTENTCARYIQQLLNDVGDFDHQMVL